MQISKFLPKKFKKIFIKLSAMRFSFTPLNHYFFLSKFIASYKPLRFLTLVQ
jgi:hypothetical protein